MDETVRTAVDIDLGLAARAVPGAVPLQLAEVDGADWLQSAKAVRAAGGRLVTLWVSAAGEGCVMSAVYALATSLVWLRLPLAAGQDYPDLSAVFPAAGRMQRAMADLFGVRAAGQADQRPWLDHGQWTGGQLPLRPGAQSQAVDTDRDYAFVPVAGEGVHEIAVGPIHAGTIEPGHFRFSVVGEKVLRLEQRLGYTHKGSDLLFIGATVDAAHRIAGRISGDATVAFAWAYAMAAETAADAPAPARAAALRAVLLERERVANHLGDLGALGNDAGFALGLSHFLRLKEDWVRLNERLFGHRFLMDRVLPGGVACDLDGEGCAALLDQCTALEKEVTRLRALYDEHSGLQDRFIGAGRVAPALADALGLCGFAGRASAQASDARCDQPPAPYAGLEVRMATQRNGDVAARVAVRFDEVFESLRLLRLLLNALPPGAVQRPLPPAQGLGAGWIESWRGPVFVGLELGADGRIARCHCHDPSWQNWPVLEHAIMGNIVPDFPLINKSFNLSYSGHDR